jgi:hypothetical protein
MLRLPLIPLAMFAGALLIGGCGEQQATSFGPTDNPLAARTEDNPDGPGAVVIHFRGVGAGFGNCDVEEDICFFLGFSLEEWTLGCEQGLPAPSGEGLRIEQLRPDGSLHILERDKQEPLLVWDAPADFCADQPIAIGTGQFTTRDSDAEFSGNRSDSFGFRVQGTVTALSDGQRYHLMNSIHVTALRNGELVVDNYEFSFRPTGQ